jgi:hypothetical protein
MDLPQKTEYGKLLLSMIPESGQSIGNSTLREHFRKRLGTGVDFTDTDYWQLRDSLIDDGSIVRGGGKGGSVRRVIVAAEEPPTASIQSSFSTERSLYEPFKKEIESGYVKDNRIKRFISEITASQGRRNTGGKWTRPDLTLIAVRTYSFTLGKRLEVITFEVKPNLDTAFEGIFEALAHSVFAHRAYLAVMEEESEIDGNADQPSDERILQECTRLGVGYITFTNPADYNTYQIETSAKLTEPDPSEVDKFIVGQISAENQDELREWLR